MHALLLPPFLAAEEQPCGTIIAELGTEEVQVRSHLPPFFLDVALRPS